VPLVIENPKGSTRSGVDPDGKRWSVTMAHDYGFIARTFGADGDGVDAFLGPDLRSDAVYIIHQVDPRTGEPDEDKVMLGFASWAEAKAGYLANYEKGWKDLGSMSETTLQGLKDWLQEGQGRPIQKSEPESDGSRWITVRPGGPGTQSHPIKVMPVQGHKGTWRVVTGADPSTAENDPPSPSPSTSTRPSSDRRAWRRRPRSSCPGTPKWPTWPSRSPGGGPDSGPGLYTGRMPLSWPSPPRLALILVLLWVAYTLLWTPGPLGLRLLGLYPKKVGSSVVGWAASRRLPEGWREPILGRFAAKYGAKVEEAEKPLAQYESLQAFFTRRLKPGLRPQEPLAAGALNSPVDARIIACGRIGQGTAIQAKGLPYRITELLKHDPDAARFEGGHYLTLYLAPKDYHRIHVPLEGQVTAVGRVEGELWPVNDASTGHVPRLYERNRRATWVATGTGADEGLEVAAILVGATHVGGVVIDDRWLAGRTLPKDGSFPVEALPCAPGDDLGTFEFGSTVVLLVGGPKASEWTASRTEGDVRVGQRLGAFR
jgi:phosphatidylserine decarboxylase